jgi:DNA adenine methylase
MSPELTAEAASNPVFEADFHARNIAVTRWESENELEHLMGDIEFHDPVIAGWWIWGMSASIGLNFGMSLGPWNVDDTGRIAPRNEDDLFGIYRSRPYLSTDGRGVTAQSLRIEGVEQDSLVMPGLLEWFTVLSNRLRHVRLLNGDWSRVVTDGASFTLRVRETQGAFTGYFLDPPYTTSERAAGIYEHDGSSVASEVKRWCIENGDHPKRRIVLAGYDSEHESLADYGWTTVSWYRKEGVSGGLSNASATGTKNHRERLWLSPYCLTQP